MFSDIVRVLHFLGCIALLSLLAITSCKKGGDKPAWDSDANLVAGDGEEIEARDTGEQAAGQIHPQIRRRLGYTADGHRIRWVEVT